MPATFEFGYCTNVHAGITLDGAKANLLNYSAPIQQRTCPDSALPLGLWLSEPVANELKDQTNRNEFKQWLESNQFRAYTLNGFPQKNFHQEIVKHEVYRPTWLDTSRVEYTKSLADILVDLISGPTGTISTVPLGWPTPTWGAEEFAAAAANLHSLAAHFAEIQQRTGKEIVLAIEPEPGCILNTAPEIVEFFDRYLFRGPNAELARRYLSVCHDVCHSGVMFEGQTFALQLYQDHGIRVGKVQVSSAVHVPWDRAVDQPETQSSMLEQLKGFNEPKYLHQTTRVCDEGKQTELSEDLPVALNHWLSAMPTSPWRVHFHVPIFVSKFGQLETTQDDIIEATTFLERQRDSRIGDADWFTGHYEVETYAWPVLPSELAADDLASGIAQELAFFFDQLESCRSA